MICRLVLPPWRNRGQNHVKMNTIYYIKKRFQYYWIPKDFIVGTDKTHKAFIEGVVNPDCQCEYEYANYFTQIKNNSFTIANKIQGGSTSIQISNTHKYIVPKNNCMYRSNCVFYKSDIQTILWLLQMINIAHKFSSNHYLKQPFFFFDVYGTTHLLSSHLHVIDVSKITKPSTNIMLPSFVNSFNNLVPAYTVFWVLVFELIFKIWCAKKIVEFFVGIDFLF